MSQKLVVNCTTGEQTIVDYTDEEEAAMAAEAETQLAATEASKAAEAQRAIDKASGETKLADLGLTADEIAALVG